MSKTQTTGFKGVFVQLDHCRFILLFHLHSRCPHEQSLHGEHSTSKVTARIGSYFKAWNYKSAYYLQHLGLSTLLELGCGCLEMWDPVSSCLWLLEVWQNLAPCKQSVHGDGWMVKNWLFSLLSFPSCWGSPAFNIQTERVVTAGVSISGFHGCACAITIQANYIVTLGP